MKGKKTPSFLPSPPPRLHSLVLLFSWPDIFILFANQTQSKQKSLLRFHQSRPFIPRLQRLAFSSRRAPLKQVPCLRAFQRMTSLWPLSSSTHPPASDNSPRAQTLRLLRRRTNMILKSALRGSMWRTEWSKNVCELILSRFISLKYKCINVCICAF